jgi:hypothetical protein
MPHWLARSLDWINVPIWTRGRIELRRVDIGIAVGAIICVAYYWHAGGWRSAVVGLAIYVFVAMVAAWLI